MARGDGNDNDLDYEALTQGCGYGATYLRLLLPVEYLWRVYERWVTNACYACGWETCWESLAVYSINYRALNGNYYDIDVSICNEKRLLRRSLEPPSTQGQGLQDGWMGSESFL